MITKQGYCTDCGGTGLTLSGTPCACRFDTKSFFDSVSCLEVPEQYQGIKFNKVLVARDMPEAYAEYLQSLHDDIVSYRLKFKNIMLCSPVSRSKTIFAYSCMEGLARQGVTVFPLYDVLELKRLMLDIDLCRKSVYGVEHPENLLKTPYLFVRVPVLLTREVYDTIITIIDRRVRRGFSTIFLYNGSWEKLVANDKNDLLPSILGDGSGSSVENKTWFPNKV